MTATTPPLGPPGRTPGQAQGRPQGRPPGQTPSHSPSHSSGRTRRRTRRRTPDRTPGQRYGFGRSLHAEWTKFRTVGSWVRATVAAALLVVAVALLTGFSGSQKDPPPVPVGPGGEPVADTSYFVHHLLAGDGSVTVSVSALRSSLSDGPTGLRPGVVPWAKAGLMIRASTRPGAPYAAVMVTGGHGVRMQDDYVNDRAGLPGAVSAGSPRWLRLVRTGDTITGYDSADGRKWTEVGTVKPAGLGPAAEVGLFVASPPTVGGGGTAGSVSTAVFGDLRVGGGGGDVAVDVDVDESVRGGAHVGVREGVRGGGQGGAHDDGHGHGHGSVHGAGHGVGHGGWTAAGWTGQQLGAHSPTFAGYPGNASGSYSRSGDRYTLTGAGDIAPAVRDTLPTGGQLRDILTGTFAALVAVIVVGALSITAEYQSGMVRTTLAAGPRRSRVLLAKASVVGAVTFVAGLAGTAVAIPLGTRLARAHGVYVFPMSFATELRVALGTAAMLAAAAILAMACGAVFRHSAGAVTTATVAVVLPYVLTAVPFMPAGAARWLDRVTPGAAFAVQQTLVPYHQVVSNYTPYYGYYPLPPWAGLAVLAGWAVAALTAAAVLLNRRDV